MHNLIIVFLLAHIIGDFYLQCAWTVRHKREWNFFKSPLKSWLALFLHVITYTICFSFGFLFLQFQPFMLFLIIIFVSHFLVDGLKSFFEKKDKPTATILLLADQLVHVGIIVLLIALFRERINESNLEWLTNHIVWFKLALCILVLLKPASIVVNSLTTECSIKGEQLDNTKNSKEVSNENEKPKIDSGLIIGIIERLMVFFLGIMSAWTAIAIVFTAKTWARQNDLRDTMFRQKFIIGTLSSVAIAIMIGFFYLKF